MVHHDLLHQILEEKKHGPFVYPYYGRYSIAEIEPTIRTIYNIPTARHTFPTDFFHGKERRQTILLIIDGLGFSHLLEHGTGTPFFDAFMKRGDVYPITSVFPSTTPAALTTIHTGYTPQEHGLVEWFTYFEEFQKVIMPMQFRSNKFEEINHLSTLGGTPQMLYERESLYEILGENGITPYAFLFKGYLPSVYRDAVQRGSRMIGYDDGRELVALLKQSLLSEQGRGFYHVYTDEIDKPAHMYGPNSLEHRQAIQSFSQLMYNGLLQDFDKEAARDITVILSADHGQISVTHDNLIYLDDFPIVWDNLQRNQDGELIVPTGSPNDVLLYIRPDRIHKVIDYLQEELADIAEVLTTEEAVKRGLFGLYHPTRRFWNRAGNVLILPFPHYQVWFAPEGKREYKQRGLHGGLSQEEMIVPFGIANLADLIELK